MITPFGLISLAACVLATACDAGGVFGIGARDDPALIIFYQDTTRITAPDTATRDVSFNIAFSSFGGGCIRSGGHDDLSVAPSEVTIRAYDHNTGGQFCTQELIRIAHVVPVRLESPGTYIIRVLGEQRGGATGSVNGPAELRRVVTVR